VDSYLAALPADQRRALEKLRRTIKAAAPKAEETISYAIPAYKYHGALIFFAAFKKHLGLYAVGKGLLKELSDELEAWEVRGTTIHFTPDKPLPATLVKKIVKLRIAENEARAKAKAAKR